MQLIKFLASTTSFFSIFSPSDDEEHSSVSGNGEFREVNGAWRLDCSFPLPPRTLRDTDIWCYRWNIDLSFLHQHADSVHSLVVTVTMVGTFVTTYYSRQGGSHWTPPFISLSLWIIQHKKGIQYGALYYQWFAPHACTKHDGTEGDKDRRKRVTIRRPGGGTNISKNL